MRKKIRRLLEKEVLTVEEAAAKYVQVTSSLLRDRIKRGTIPTVLKERKHFLDRKDVEAINFGEQLIPVEDE